MHGFIEGRGGIEMSGSGMTLQHDLKFYPSDKPLAENDYRREKERILRKVSSDPNPDHYLELAQLEYRRGLYEESKKAVEKALQERPDFPEGELLLSKILEKMDREAEAEQAFLKLMERHPSYSCAYREYARFLLEKKRADPPRGMPFAARIGAESAGRSRPCASGRNLCANRARKAGRAPPAHRFPP